MKEIRNQYVELFFDKETSAVCSKFLKYTPHIELMPIFENAYKLMRFYKATKTLVDLKLLPVHDIQSTEYINNVWFPTVKEIGIRYIAFVLSDSAIAKMSARNAHKGAETIGGFVVNNFQNEQEAREWLSSLN